MEYIDVSSMVLHLYELLITNRTQKLKRKDPFQPSEDVAKRLNSKHARTNAEEWGRRPAERLWLGVRKWGNQRWLHLSGRRHYGRGSCIQRAVHGMCGGQDLYEISELWDAHPTGEVNILVLYIFFKYVYSFRIVLSESA